MLEIAEHVFIETEYPGVTLGAVLCKQGTVMIDAPFRPEDTRSWRSALQSHKTGSERLLVNLDAHFDRTIGARAMEATVVGQENVAASFRNRPLAFKPQQAESGAEWEQAGNLGTVRWAPPEITFSEELTIHWDDFPMRLVFRPGSARGAAWVVLPKQKVVFIGDAVTPGEPPFLADGEPSKWIENLHLLSSPDFKHYQVVSGRGGLINGRNIHSQINFLEKVVEKTNALAERSAPPEETEGLVSGLLKNFEGAADRKEIFRTRLKWGLFHCYARKYRPDRLDESA